MKCLIVAAGLGSRLGGSLPKPLTPVLGVPLVERVILAAQEAGATEFLVAVREGDSTVPHFLQDLARRRVLDLSVLLLNADGRENGCSVLSARSRMQEPFLLLMADHLVPPKILRRLIDQGLGDSDLLLAVDRSNGFVEESEVTRVLVRQDLIRDIGKGITEFNGYDTGAFLCSPSVFGALERAAAGGDTSLSAGVRELAGRGLARALFIKSGSWVDVDTPADLKKAERLLLDSLGKPTDGPVSRYLNRPLSRALSGRLAKTAVTPNAISLVSLLVALLGSLLFLHPSYWALALGGVLAQISSVLDGSDGEVARLKLMRSEFGGWFDTILDRYADAFLLAGLTYHASLDRPGPLTLAIGFLALTGSFVNTYSAVAFDKALNDGRVRSSSGVRLGRDVRLFLVFLGAVTALPLVALGLIALLMNLEVVRRALLLRRLPSH